MNQKYSLFLNNELPLQNKYGSDRQQMDKIKRKPISMGFLIFNFI